MQRVKDIVVYNLFKYLFHDTNFYMHMQMAPKNKDGTKRKKQLSEGDDDDDYRKRRDRNNQVID